MLLARRNNSVSNWLNSWFNDNFFDTNLMPRMNATAPAVNVKESATAYTMQVAAPGLKKDMVKMNIDKDGYLNVSIFLIFFNPIFPMHSAKIHTFALSLQKATKSN